MAVLLAAAGRFKMEWLLAGLEEKLGGNFPSTIWGLAYCSGNRLEVVRSYSPRNSNVAFPQLADVRTDMAMFYLYDNKDVSAPIRVQPFVRQGDGFAWAFCQIGKIIGKISHPERLVRGGHYTESSDPSEIFFVSLLEHFSLERPIESIEEFMGQFSEESALSFCLLSPEIMAVASWCSNNERGSAGLWLGKGELVRVVASPPPPPLSGIVWSELGNRSIIVLLRERRSVI